MMRCHHCRRRGRRQWGGRVQASQYNSFNEDYKDVKVELLFDSGASMVSTRARFFGHHDCLLDMNDEVVMHILH
jgi:tryptophanase